MWADQVLFLVVVVAAAAAAAAAAVCFVLVPSYYSILTTAVVKRVWIFFSWIIITAKDCILFSFLFFFFLSFLLLAQKKFYILHMTFLICLLFPLDLFCKLDPVYSIVQQSSNDSALCNDTAALTSDCGVKEKLHLFAIWCTQHCNLGLLPCHLMYTEL